MSMTAPAIVPLDVPPETGDRRSYWVCVVDDDPMFREYACRQLSELKHRPFPAQNGAELQTALADNRIDCIILDYNLDSENGLEVYERMRRLFGTIPPVVMLTASENQRTTIKVFRAGIEDFVPKRGLRAGDLTAAIEKAVTTRAEDDARHGEFEKLRREAAFDPVTGFYSRREIDERLVRLAESVDRRQGRFAVIACTLGGIQTLIDGFGLVFGDRAMRMTASRLQKVIRGTDICARYESTVLLYVIDTDVSPATVDAICARLAEALSFEFRSDNIRVPIVASCGAAYYPVDGEVPGELVASALMRVPDRRAEVLASPALAVVSAPPIARTAASLPAEPEEGRTENNRRFRRQRVLKTARIVLHDGYSTIDCTVRDVSEGGARLRVQDAFTAPETFVLLMLDTGTSRKVVRRWQAGGNVGVEFVS